MTGGLAARAIAFYLPQYHPTAENDAWWGPGFTEWTNTAGARRLFPGHRQPDLPGELGFYDLRLAVSRQAQSDLAEQYGVSAFCYWHYWFGGGRRMLELPFRQVLQSGEPRLPFCLGWANQTWTGHWHGARGDVLIEQTYPGDDEAHFAALLPALRDDRYLRVDGRPVFYVFRPELLPNPWAFVDRWQQLARRAGLDGLYLVAEVGDTLGRGPAYTRVQQDGFDAGAYLRLPAVTTRAATIRAALGRRLLRLPEVYRYSRRPIPPPEPVLVPGEAGRDRLLPAVYPNWDNTPRAGRRGVVLLGSSPEKFRPHVRAAVELLADRPAPERLLWVKSWNEWAEGNHLEPDLRYGRGWLEVLHEELTRPG